MALFYQHYTYNESSEAIRRQATPQVASHSPRESLGHGNIPIEHHPTIRYMVYNGYYKVMANIPKMGHLPTPGE